MPDDEDDQPSNPFFGEGETIEEPGQEARTSERSVDSDPKYRDKEWLYQQYVVLGKTQEEIADDCEGSPKTVWRWLQEYDIETRSGGPRPGPWKDADWLRTQYVDLQKSAPEIAAEQDCHPATIYNWLAEHGIDTRDHDEQHPASREDRQYRDAEWLRRQYVVLGKSADQIAAALDENVAPSTIRDWLRRHEIPVRSVSESRRLTEARPAQVDPGDRDGDDRDGQDSVALETGRRRFEGAPLDMSLRTADERPDRPESPYRDEEWLRARYEEEGSAAPIAEQCNVDPGTIYYWMDKHGIERSQGREGARYRDADWRLAGAIRVRFGSETAVRCTVNVVVL